MEKVLSNLQSKLDHPVLMCQYGSAFSLLSLLPTYKGTKNRFFFQPVTKSQKVGQLFRKKRIFK